MLYLKNRKSVNTTVVDLETATGIIEDTTLLKNMKSKKVKASKDYIKLIIIALDRFYSKTIKKNAQQIIIALASIIATIAVFSITITRYMLKEKKD
jgi:hypothetical protein